MEPEHRRGSDESLTSATESDLVAKVNKLSSVLLGTSSNVTVLNERLTEYQRSHEVALNEIRRTVSGEDPQEGVSRNDNEMATHSSPLAGRRAMLEKESTPRNGHHHQTPPVTGDRSPINTLVSLLGEKDMSLTSLHKEVTSLRSELDRTKAELRQVKGELARDKENTIAFRKTVHVQLRKNIDMVNRLIEHSRGLPASVKRAIL
ncbi:hypothetical protein BIW11_11832, partial [Tropilaelaps mercedesae]